ncbi:hypothetical protein D3C72_2093350 [compost metagenome]
MRRQHGMLDEVGLGNDADEAIVFGDHRQGLDVVIEQCLPGLAQRGFRRRRRDVA